MSGALPILAAMLHRTIETRAPVDPVVSLAPQAAGRGDPAFLFLDTEARIALRLPTGPATIRFSGRGRRIEAEAWGPGAEQALDRAPRIVGAEDDPRRFHPEHPIVERLARRHPFVRITWSCALTDVLIRTAVAQRVTGKEAKRSYQRLATDLGEPAPGPGGLLLPPDPEVLRSMPYYEFHPYGIEASRAMRIRSIASRAEALDRTAARFWDDAVYTMAHTPGVGPWSVGIAGTTAIGWPDAVPIGDYNLPNQVAYALAAEPRADDDRMLELLEPYRAQRQRGRVVRLIQAGTRHAPRYGPRRPIRNIEGI